MSNLYQELACASSPLRYHCPSTLLHGSSPLARPERSSFPVLPVKKPSPAFRDIVEAMSEPPPPYHEVPNRVPFASFYGVAYDEPLRSPEIVSISSSLETMDIDELYLQRFESNDLMEIDASSPETSRGSTISSLPFSSSWTLPSPALRETLERRLPNSAGGRALECLRLDFILRRIPHLAHALLAFERRANSPAMETFYEWYNALSVDQRVKFLPYFVPERLDLVRPQAKSLPVSNSGNTIAPINGTPTSPSKDIKETTAAISARVSGVCGIDEKNGEVPRYAAPTEISSKSKERASSPPPLFFADATSWEEFDTVSRWLRVLSQRQAGKNLRKDAVVRSWTWSINYLGRAQWDRQVTSCTSYRNARLQLADEYLKGQDVRFEGRKYSASIFPTSWRRYHGTTVTCIPSRPHW